MKLVTRVSLFFLVALAVFMAANALALNLLARHYLYRQFDDQLHAALRALVAAADVEEDGVEWNAIQGRPEVDAEFDNDSLRWAVFDEGGDTVDFSRNQSAAEAKSLLQEDSTARSASARTWRSIERKLAATQPDPGDMRDPNEYREIKIVVAGSTAAIDAALHRLALLSVGLSAAAWLLAAGIGRWYCAAALAPVRKMAASARSIAPEDSTRRLPVSPTNDELAELGRSFNGLLDQLFQAYERQRRFTGDAAHQLRTPLTVFQGQLDVALRRPRTAEEYQQIMQTLQSEVIDLKQLVEAMLMLARSTQEIAPAQLQAIDLAAWLRSRCTYWQTGRRGDDLQIAADEPVVARVSPPLLAQLLDNLVDNASKYSPPGKPIRIAVKRDASRAQAVVSVQDEGPGIATEHAAEIFEPFYRSPAARQQGVAGAGLGLSIALRIAELLGGTLTCQSTPGAGSTFSLRLPLASQAAEPGRAEAGGRAAAEIAPGR
jgi:heavy metal sensor kinase